MKKKKNKAKSPVIIYLNLEEREAVKAVARANGLTMSSFIRRAVGLMPVYRSRHSDEEK